MTDRKELAKLFPPIRHKEKPLTHRDELRQKSDEELAAFLADHPCVSKYDPKNPQHVAWLKWLRETVT